MMNHRHISVMISEQDEDFLRSMMALKGREGACGKENRKMLIPAWQAS